MSVPAIVAAGDLRAAKAIHGESKAYLEIAGASLVARTIATLQAVPEVSEVWVVGNAERLHRVLDARPAARHALRKPLHVVPQFRNLYENGWETYRRLLPDAGPDGRDPGPADADQAVLYPVGRHPVRDAAERSRPSCAARSRRAATTRSAS